jgi:formate/nitrite transporter FocA (FNT family)
MFKKSILSGFLIGLAGLINITVGTGILGAILFSSGVIAICLLNIPLYTGIAGSWEIRYLYLWKDLGGLGRILIGNVIGTFLASLLVLKTGIPSSLFQIIEFREESTILEAFISGIGCGVLMEIAVYGWKERKSFLLILLYIPALILTGMYPSIVDSFYYLAAWKYLDPYIIVIWLVTVLGNFVGCNIRRILC